jgi:hypothetical protein
LQKQIGDRLIQPMWQTSVNRCIIAIMARRRVSPRRWLLRTLPFALIGAAMGVPLSYHIQNGLVRGMVSRRDYTRQVFSAAPSAIWNQIRSQGASPDPLGIVERLLFTVMLTAGAGVFAGWWMTSGK